jgi:hypothetical protein
VTKRGSGGGSGDLERCVWCGRRLPARAATGRPRRYCRQACRQRDYEARLRSDEAGLSETELIVARHELDALYDLLYVLECAVEDVERDLAGSSPRPSRQELADAVDWLLQAARPLVGRRLASPSPPTV